VVRQSLTGLGAEVLKALILVGCRRGAHISWVNPRKHKEALPGLVSGLVSYAIGVFLASFAFVIGFLSQTLGYIADRENDKKRTYHYIMLWLAIILIFSSCILFIHGTVTNANALKKLF
jgi:hypothetical protein